MKQIYLDDKDVKTYLFEIIRQVHKDCFRPEVIIGLVRGGSTPANYLSQFYDLPCIMVNKEDVPKIPIIYRNALVIDDINDTGKALTDFNNALFELSESIEVKYATLVTNEASCFDVDYAGYYINKAEDPSWIVFPWENWWNASSLT